MKQILGAFRRTSFGTVAALFLLTVVGVALPTHQATAAMLQYRSLQLSSSTPSDASITAPDGTQYAPGTGANGQQVSHTYVFQASASGQSIKALSFKYCDDPFGYVGVGNCDVPAGFSAAAAPKGVVYKSNGGTAAAPTFEATGVDFNVDGTPTATDLTIKSATAVTTGSGVANGQFIKVVFTADATFHFVNPTSSYANNVAAPNTSQTFYAHVTTYNSDTTIDNTTDIDEGTVTSSVANTVSINTRVQETLKFSVGGSGGSADTTPGQANDPTATCAPLDTDGALTMGDTNQALSTTTTGTAKSFARITTNSSRGTKIMYSGQSLTSTAGDVIDAIGTTPATSVAGTNEQFGLAVLAADSGTPSPTTYEDYSQLNPSATYGFVANAGKYAFDADSDTAPAVLASSNTIITCDTLPIQYIANITNQTPAGLYTTRVSYIAVPSY